MIWRGQQCQEAASHGKVWLGTVWPARRVEACPGMAWQSRLVVAGLGGAAHATDWLGRRVGRGRVEAWQGPAWNGRRGVGAPRVRGGCAVRPGLARPLGGPRCVLARPGLVSHGRRGKAGFGSVRLAVACLARRAGRCQGAVRRAALRPGLVRLGVAVEARHRESGHGVPRPDPADTPGLVLAWRGRAGQATAWQGTPGASGPGSARHGKARCAESRPGRRALPGHGTAGIGKAGSVIGAVRQSSRGAARLGLPRQGEVCPDSPALGGDHPLMSRPRAATSS